MEQHNKLIDTLGKHISFSQQLYQILQNLSRIHLNSYSRNQVKTIQSHLVSLTCQHKNLLQFVDIQEIGLNEKCLKLVTEILIKLSKLNIDSLTNIGNLFHSHIMTHSSCFISYSVFYLIVQTNQQFFAQSSIATSLQKLKKVNSNIIMQFGCQSGISLLKNAHSNQANNSKLPTFLNCESNLSNFLQQKFKPIQKQAQKDITSTHGSKIPPLLLPTSKSINSSRYSALSRQQRRKGVADLRKLAAGLGQSFIAVQLGSLLSYKRMKQVHQFSENTDFKQKCLDRIQTDRLNSSRIGNLVGISQFDKANNSEEQNSKKYHKRVLLLNANLIYKRLMYQKDRVQQQQKDGKLVNLIQKTSYFPADIFNQFYDMSILGIIQLNNLQQSKSDANNSSHDGSPYQTVNKFETISHQGDIYSSIKPLLMSLQKIIGIFMQRANEDSELTHLTMLLNRNKQNTPNYYEMKTQRTQVIYQIEQKSDSIPTKKIIPISDKYSLPKHNFLDNDGLKRQQQSKPVKRYYSLQRIDSVRLIPNLNNGCKLSHQQIINSRAQSDHVIFVIQKSLKLLFGAAKSFNLSMQFHHPNCPPQSIQLPKQYNIEFGHTNLKSPKAKLHKQQFNKHTEMGARNKNYRHQRSNKKQNQVQQNSFYQYESNILGLLGFYLQNNHSKSTPYQVIDMLMPFLLLIKRQLIELSHPFISKDFDVRSTGKFYNRTLNDQYMKNAAEKNLKPNSFIKKEKKKKSSTMNSPSPFVQKVFSPCKRLGKDSEQEQSNEQSYQLQNKKDVPLIYCHHKLFARYLLVISCLFTNNKHVQKLFSNFIFKNIHFMEMISNYLQFLFKKGNAQDQIIIVLKFYKRALQTYHQRKHRNQDSKTLRILFQHISNLLYPKTGCIADFLTKNEEMISPWNLDNINNKQYQIPNSFDKMPGNYSFDISAKQKPSLAQSANNFKQLILTHEILRFVAQVYYHSQEDYASGLLQQDVVPFYIKYCFINFVKLYSFLTVNQLANLNLQNINFSNSKDIPSYQPFSSQVFMIDLLKILTNISINRTLEISKKIRQYRILQFFIRELELQFCVSHNIDKYVRTMMKLGQSSKQKQKSDSKKNKKSKQTQKAQESSVKKQKRSNTTNTQVNSALVKKPFVPGLNLAGNIFKGKEMQKQQDMDSLQNSEKNKHEYNTKIYKNNGNANSSPSNKSQSEQSSPQNDLPMLKFGNNDQKKPAFDIPVLRLPSSQSSVSHQRQSNKFDNNKKSQKSQKSNNFPQFNLQLGMINRVDACNSSKQSQMKLIYRAERRIRKIYSNRTLHSQSILLVLSLLLYKGLLDKNYCERYPITQGKINVLYVLHFHLNHEANRPILPLLGEGVTQIKPYLAGQRLVKLLASQFTDISHYEDWVKISKGAYGTVYSCTTSFHQPHQVAIKQMSFPKTIYQRCVLHDIFTEITSLENFRLDHRVTTMYNYGVVDNTYVIVMKKYQCSLRQWCVKRVQKRRKQKQKLGTSQKHKNKHPNAIQNGGWNLGTILSVYYQILKIVKVLHEHNITHYDIKGDNILLQFQNKGEHKNKQIEDCTPTGVVFGDFGQCKIFQNQRDELDLRSRGTQCIMSPQMLTITQNNKKQADNYDRRKKVGTTRASDIWSVGCLLYQMITGDYLYHRSNFISFFSQVTKHEAEILLEQDQKKLENNIYIIDFLKYILIRDPQHRPSIDNIIARFQNLYALLVPNPQPQNSSMVPRSPLIFQQTLDDLLDQYLTELNNAKYVNRFSQQQASSERVIFKSQNKYRMLKIMEDIYFCQDDYFQNYTQKVRRQGITHVITSLTTIPKFFVSLIIPISSKQSKILASQLCPKISDILRQVLLLKGKLLFVNDKTNYATNLLIFTLSYWFRCSVYQTWCLINNQILLFPTFTSDLQHLSKTLHRLNLIELHIEALPKLQCICGSVTMILRRKVADKKGEFRICKCKKRGKERQQSECPSLSCMNYMQFLKKRYNIGWDHIKWSLLSQSNFLTNPLETGFSQNSLRSQLILNSGLPSENMIEAGSVFRNWRVYKCKICEMWMMSINQNQQIWAVMNNQIKSIRQGIMIPNAQQNFKMRTPALNYYTLSKLHMIQQ